MEKSIFNRLARLAACGLWFASAVTGYAQSSVTYLDWDDAKKEMVGRTVTDYELVTSETRTFADGKWYVVADQITINGRSITVSGSARLILCDDASLTVGNLGDFEAAIDVSVDVSLLDGSVTTNALTIYAQEKGTGRLEATGGNYGAGIGGGSGNAGGTVTINGGRVTANGGKWAAGIGGAFKGAGGTVTINGGQVKAVGQGGGKGIGGGSESGGGNVKITGGTVSAEGWNGINAVTIDGGSVKSVSSLGKKQIDPAPTNTRKMNVYCVTVECEWMYGLVRLVGLEDFGVKDIYPLDGNKLYLYLPNGDYEFSVNGYGYRAVVRNAGVRATPIEQLPTDGSPFDGVLMQDGRPLGNTNATALVRVDGVDFDVAIRTDADGRFAASLPRQATPASKVVFASAKVGDRTIEVDRPLTVPQLPYAFGADTADRVVADGNFTVVDSEVTVLGDLEVGEDVTVENDSMDGSVNGGITVRQPLPAKATVLRKITAADDTARIFGIGDPITVFDAHLEGKVLYGFVGNENANMLYAYLAPKSQYSATVEQFQIDRAVNFVFGATPCRSPKFAPENLYGAFPDSDTSKFFAYTAEADGFVTVEIRSAPSYGGIALTVDFKDSKADAPWCHAFEQGWHRSAWNPQRWDVYVTDSRREADRPAFNREYTFAIRRGETMHVRTLLQANFETETRLPGTSDEFIVSRMQCNSAIDLHVKVSFHPIGFAK